MVLKLIHIVLLVVWTAFIFWLLTMGRGDLIRLLHPRLWWVLAVAIVILLLFLASLIVPGGQSETRNPVLFELPGLMILLIPVLYFSLATNARLDGTTLENRLIQHDNGTFINNLPATGFMGDSEDNTMLFSRILRQPGKYEDKVVEVVCQSFVHEDLPENTAMCYRYLITCCAADALPAFIFLSHDSDLEIKNNRWIQVKGPLSVIKRENMEFPSVNVDSLGYVKEPDFPWAL